MFNRVLNRAELASLAGVSRAAVTKWFREGRKTGWINMETKTLRHLAEGLNLEPHYLLENHINLETQENNFLWDRLFPSMEAFLCALRQKRPQAIARFVEVMGFWQTARIAGKNSIKNFSDYKKFIKPARRKELEILWPLYLSTK